MSPQAVRVRTSSGWQDIAIQGAPGVPGATPSAKARSGVFSITADTNARFLTAAVTVEYDQIGGNCMNSGRFFAPAAGKYLVGFRITDLAPGTASLGVILNSGTVLNRITHPVSTGADGTKGGIELWGVYTLAAGNDLMIHGWSSGGGSTNIITVEAIRLDALGPGAFDGTWQNWTPIIKQPSALGFTNTRSRYCQMGKLVHFMTYMTVTAAGVINNAINVSVPVPMVAGSTNLVVGHFWVSASQISPPNVAGIVVAVDVNSVQLIMGGQPSNFVGATPSFALASGNLVMVSGTYEAA